MLQSSDSAGLNQKATDMGRIMCYGRGWKLWKIEGTSLAHHINIRRKQTRGRCHLTSKVSSSYLNPFAGSRGYLLVARSKSGNCAFACHAGFISQTRFGPPLGCLKVQKCTCFHVLSHHQNSNERQTAASPCKEKVVGTWSTYCAPTVGR